MSTIYVFAEPTSNGERWARAQGLDCLDYRLRPVWEANAFREQPLVPGDRFVVVGPLFGAEVGYVTARLSARPDMPAIEWVQAPRRKWWKWWR